ncbi:methyltransferase [Longispora albida]|uniref:methyltransferase n=1 Tax=Longispora albida TaxID=203523 RepID=UPI0009FCE8F9|nr:methyltransferase [Longispora albida]
MDALDLVRFPIDPRDQLRAWDAADEYLLKELPGLTGTVVVSGDRWGALATALAPRHPGIVQITDSYLTQQATLANLARNGVAAGAVELRTTRDPVPERIDVLLVRVPKSLALLEDQLHRFAPALHAGSVVLGTGMVKEIHTSTLELFERILGPTRTSLAERKARLIHTTPGGVNPGPDPWPKTYRLPADAGPVAGLTVTDHAGVFSAGKLDIGTRFFLDHLPRGRHDTRVLDLGCGNGIVGLAASLADPGAELVFADESYQALASAEATFTAHSTAAASFVAGDGVPPVHPGGFDLVLNNPPFHTHQATTDAIAWRMFTGARRALRPGGELWVIGNRHLGYHVKLRRVFGTCELVASNPKFVVLRAVRS